jgi:hypothetical protein
LSKNQTQKKENLLAQTILNYVSQRHLDTGMTLTEPTIDFLLSNGFTKTEADNVQNAWLRLRENDESLSAMLIRLGYFRSAATRTLELMQKGFLTNVDRYAVFNNDAIERLKTDSLTIATKGNLPSNQNSDSQFRFDHVSNTNVSNSQNDSRKDTFITADPITKFVVSKTQTKVQNDSTHLSRRDDSDSRNASNKNPEAKKTEHSRQKLTLPSQSTPPTTRPVAFNMPQVGDVLGRCLLTGILGQGGFGTVFSALHTALNISVAVKVISCKDRIPDAVRQIIRREAQTLAKLNHPNVVRILDFEDCEMPYFTMEFVEGPSLAELIKQAGSIRFDRAVEIILEIISGLSAAWKMGFVHRDIKPGNILISKSGQAKLADLGLARVPGMDDELLKPDQNRPLGTCAYISPEQIRNGSNVDFRSDIYSLTCTLYHIVMGELPFPGRSQREVIMKHLAVEPTNPHLIAPERVSAEAGAIFVKGLQKDPDARFNSYEEFASALIGVKGVKPVSSPDISIKTKSEINLVMQGLEEPAVDKKSESRSKIMQWIFKDRKK